MDVIGFTRKAFDLVDAEDSAWSAALPTLERTTTMPKIDHRVLRPTLRHIQTLTRVAGDEPEEDDWALQGSRRCAFCDVHGRLMHCGAAHGVHPSKWGRGLPHLL